MLNISEHVVVVYTNIFNGYLLNYILKTKHQKQSQDMLVIYKKWHHLAYMLLKGLGYYDIYNQWSIHGWARVGLGLTNQNQLRFFKNYF